MSNTEYGKHIFKQPLVKGRFAPTLHICGEKHMVGGHLCPGSNFPGFPAEQTLMCITEPFLMKAAPHAHDYDQLLYFLGGNPLNLFEFEAEIEVTLGEPSEVHIINTTSILYVPKGTMHCPINFKKIEKPILFGHLCFASEYTRSQGEMTGHPRLYETYSPEEVAALKRDTSK